MLERESDARADARAGTPQRASRPASRTSSVHAVTELRAEVARRLNAGGVRAALSLLNARTRFRYTGLYRLAPPQLRNVALVDRENPAINVSGAVCDLRETYCSITAGGDAPFEVPDAPVDPRLDAHPARQSVQSYGGVPVRGRRGEVLGTLCHFDGRPRLLPSGELALLEQVAPLFTLFLERDAD